jgi:hypothetical protein
VPVADLLRAECVRGHGHELRRGRQYHPAADLRHVHYYVYHHDDGGRDYEHHHEHDNNDVLLPELCNVGLRSYRV